MMANRRYRFLRKKPTAPTRINKNNRDSILLKGTPFYLSNPSKS
jgi:hypothetical protein